MTSTLGFTGDDRVDITQYAAMVTLGHVRPSRWSARLALGAVLDGSLEDGARTHEIGPGVVGSISAAKMWTARAWFVTGSLGFSASRTTTGEVGVNAPRETLAAYDARIGAIAGRTFGVASPYLLARGFGGPVLWRRDGEDVTGSDRHHYQLGAGASIAAGRLSLTIDVSVLGERSAALGAALELR
ncbi:MAG: hypothetical protein F9K40_20510 [Kofleriaceae bacterium]|nr:MAG: hypothetical protein F9K40_20510 [Kofleriaceae bacterium]MBZ0236844.1 hypothetical protein [Kofleriaceae bacterium]